MEKVAFLCLDLESLGDALCFRGEEDKSLLPEVSDGAFSFLSLAAKMQAKATIFALSSNLERDKDFLKKAISEGHEIALHGYEHKTPTSYQLEEFIGKTMKAKQTIEEALGAKIIGYRAPGWAISRQEHDALPSLGFAYSSSICFTKGWASFSPPPKLDDYEKLSPNVYRKDGFYEFALPTIPKGPCKDLALGGGVVPRFFPPFEVKCYLNDFCRLGGAMVLNVHPFELSSYSWKARKDLKLRDNVYLGSGRKKWGKRLEEYIALLQKKGYRFLSFGEFIASLG
jgi:hypothetical protein